MNRDYNKLILYMCKNGNLNMVHKVYELMQLNQLNQPNQIDIDYDTAFLLCCEYGHLEIIKWLLIIKPNINISIYFL